jgi:hypothetical protein
MPSGMQLTTTGNETAMEEHVAIAETHLGYAEGHLQPSEEHLADAEMHMKLVRAHLATLEPAEQVEAHLVQAISSPAPEATTIGAKAGSMQEREVPIKEAKVVSPPKEDGK